MSDRSGCRQIRPDLKPLLFPQVGLSSFYSVVGVVNGAARRGRSAPSFHWLLRRPAPVGRGKNWEPWCGWAFGSSACAPEVVTSSVELEAMAQAATRFSGATRRTNVCANTRGVIGVCASIRAVTQTDLSYFVADTVPAATVRLRALPVPAGWAFVVVMELLARTRAERIVQIPTLRSVWRGTPVSADTREAK